MEWKTIDSAPKDDTHILVSDGRSVEKAYFDKDIMKWCEAWDGDQDFDSLFDPTHWMPLPPLPQFKK